MKIHEQAKAWRLKMGLRVEDLQDITGYAKETIWMFEKGKRYDKREHSDFAWQRYKMACAAAEQQIKTGKAFQW